MSIAEQFQNELLKENAVDVAGLAANMATATVAKSFLEAAEAAKQFEGVDHGDVPVAKRFYRIAKLCQMWQVSPAAVKAIVKASGAQWAYAVDDILFIDGENYLTAGTYLLRQRKGL